MESWIIQGLRGISKRIKLTLSNKKEIFFNKQLEVIVILKLYNQQGNELIWVFAEPFDACYYSEGIVDNTKDIYLRVIDIIGNHYSFESIINTLIAIIRDIENCNVILEKYFIFLNLYRNIKKSSIRELIITDLECLFGNIRSLYDLLQNLIRDLWERTANKSLPNSFFKTVKQDPRDLKRKYNLPDPIIDFYNSTKDFIITCKDIRDSIVHRGLNIEIVFCIEEGFALQKDNPLFPDLITKKFNIWPEEKVKENGLVSILALISYLIKELLENTDMLSKSLIKSIPPQPAITNSHKLFLRGPYTHHLLNLEEYLKIQWINTNEKFNKFSANCV